MRVGLYINSKKKKLPQVLDIIFELFSLDKGEIVFLNAFDFINKRYGLECNSHNKSEDVDYDVLLAIGGDGTTMSAIRSQFHLPRVSKEREELARIKTKTLQYRSFFNFTLRIITVMIHSLRKLSLYYDSVLFNQGLL